MLANFLNPKPLKSLRFFNVFGPPGGGTAGATAIREPAKMPKFANVSAIFAILSSVWQEEGADKAGNGRQYCSFERVYP